MYHFLKYTHLTFILLAVLLFVVSFFWLKTGHKNAQKVVFKKILLHTHFTILLLGLALVWMMHINPFESHGFWVLEKIGAFVAYSIMVIVALDKNKGKGVQLLSFIGAFGWLMYIGQLAISKQAILLVG
ncbi:SirB2 family protein [Psychromonas antarctica]|jgi:uncharacterized membrane protein SirB2|uniref:SirB2 family protein n=1 Tax=Psychromonas antarctica TaxID=67573 RepID=UPI001EE9024A|nr:SirB2 family protein [Psychromonas antarctica]MCG6201535.1 SirB2 family protein [Psychromonas antarctica]